MSIALDVQNIEKSYDSFRLQNISFQASLKESIAVVGPSGSGKTTLLNLLGALDTPDRGSITLLEEPYSPQKAQKVRKNHIGFVFQSFHLLESLNCLENILLPLWIRFGYSYDKKPLAQALLEQVGLNGFDHKKVQTLSGGEMQRIAIARALVSNPTLILADEPTGNLDPASSEQIQSLLLNLCKDHNKLLIVATHDLDFAHKCDRIITLKK